MDHGIIAVPPRDRFSLVYIIFLFMGVGCNLPLNVYITAKIYYQVRLAVYPTIPYILNNFEGMFVNIFQLFNFGALIFVVVYSKKIPPLAQVLYPYLTIFTMFLATTIMVFFVEIPGDYQAVSTLVFIGIVGVAAAFLQGGVYSLASKFAPIYMQAVMTGEAGAGVGVALLQFVTMWGSTTKPGQETTPADVTGPGLGYFGGSTVIIAICLVGYGILFILPFSRFHLKHGFVPYVHHHHGEDGATMPLLHDGTPRPSFSSVPILATSPFAGSLIGSVPNEYAGSLASYMGYGTPKSIEEEPHIIVGGAYHVGPVGTVGTLGDVIMHRPPTPAASNYEPSTFQSPRPSIDIHDLGSYNRQGGLHSFTAGLETPTRMSTDFNKSTGVSPQKNIDTTEQNQKNNQEVQEDDLGIVQDMIGAKEIQRNDFSFTDLVDQDENSNGAQKKLTSKGQGLLAGQLQEQGENGFEFADADQKQVEAFNPYEKDNKQDENNNEQKENGVIDGEHIVMQATEEEEWTILRRFKAISGYCLTIALVFIVTLAGFPAISSDICSVQNPATSPPCKSHPENVSRIFGDLFVPLGFIMYQCGDLSGRISAGFGPWRHNRPKSRWLILYACCRTVLIVLLLFCNIITNPSWMVPNYLNNDVAPLLILFFIGNTTGHCASTTMMHALTPLPQKEREGGGYILAFIMAVGLLGGSSLSLALLAIFKN